VYPSVRERTAPAPPRIVRRKVRPIVMGEVETMQQTVVESIAPEERSLAAMTHLAGLAGYVIPLGGVVVPLIIWITKSDSPMISRIAKQALLLNVVIFLLAGAFALLLLTIVLIPLVFLGWIALGIAAVAFPVIGAIKANDGVYYAYPLVGTLLR